MPGVVVVQQADEPGRRKGRPKGRRRRKGWRGRRGDGVPAKQRSGWRRGQRCDVDGGDGDVDRRTGDVQEPTEDGEVLDADEEATPASFGRGGGDAGDEGGVAEPREVVATSTGAQAGRQRRLEVVQWRQRHWTTAGTRLRRSPRETEGRPGERRRLRRRGRRRHGRPAHGRGGRGGWKRPARGKEKGDGGEVARDHGRSREGAKTRERGEGVPFYRRGEGAGHGGGRNGGGKGGRRPWKLAGVGAGVPGDWGHDSRGKLGQLKRIQWGLKPPN
uniref:Retrotransposon protein, putative, unclassified n=1 Tax=Oryza sativa subsp. japonica TaxID=39947 RepID=Q2R2N8_ORYSJ|nr:retrotransposon protein, putative, unclassified [Oryza sativa Japonica Group]